MESNENISDSDTDCPNKVIKESSKDVSQPVSLQTDLHDAYTTESMNEAHQKDEQCKRLNDDNHNNDQSSNDYQCENNEFVESENSNLLMLSYLDEMEGRIEAFRRQALSLVEEKQSLLAMLSGMQGDCTTHLESEQNFDFSLNFSVI